MERKKIWICVVVLILYFIYSQWRLIYEENRVVLEHGSFTKPIVENETKINSVIVKGGSGYTCILPPTDFNKQYFPSGENYYSGSSEMLKFICEYLKRRNLVNEIIPKSKKMMKRLIYESHLMEMVGLRDAVMKKYANSLIDKEVHSKNKRRFVIRFNLIRKGIIDYCKSKPPSFVNGLSVNLRAYLFSIQREDYYEALKLFINYYDKQVVKGVAKEIVKDLPKHLTDIGGSLELAKLMKEKLSETVYNLLQRFGNSFSVNISPRQIFETISRNRKLFINYENCFVNHTARPMVACLGFIKNMPKPLFDIIISDLYQNLIQTTTLQSDRDTKPVIYRMLSKRLNEFLKKL